MRMAHGRARAILNGYNRYIRSRTRKLAYRLSVVFSEDYHETIQAPSAGLGFNADTRTTFYGKGVPVWLVKSGTRSAPQYELRARGKTSAKVVLTGDVAFAGQGHEEITTSSGSCVSTPITYTVPIASAARVEVSLTHTSLNLLTISSTAVVNIHDVTSCTNGMRNTTDGPWGYGPVNSPTSPHRATLAGQLGGIRAKTIRFGSSFTLPLQDAPENDPALKTETPTVSGGVQRESWSYAWRLEAARYGKLSPPEDYGRFPERLSADELAESSSSSMNETAS